MGYVDLVDFDKKIGGSFTEKVISKMVQERLSWNYGVHVGKWSHCIEYVCKIERSSQDYDRQFKIKNVCSHIDVK